MSFWKKIFAKDGSSADENTAAAAEQDREEKAKLRNADALKFDGLRLLQAGYAEPALCQKEPEKAERALRDAIEIDPFNEEAHLRLATLLSGQNRTEEAVSLLKPFVDEERATVRIKQQLAALYRVQGNESAAEALEATISEDDLAETDGRADFNNLYTGGLY